MSDPFCRPSGYSEMTLAVKEICTDEQGVYDRQRHVFACETCGAIVVDTPRHSTWHARNTVGVIG